MASAADSDILWPEAPLRDFFADPLDFPLGVVCPQPFEVLMPH